MTSLYNKIKKVLRREPFITNPFSIIVSPYYIIRNGLFKNILAMSKEISGKVLDFGCGSKPYESLFLKAENYIGVDIEESGHNHNNSKVDSFYDGKKLNFDDNYFDSAVCLEVFEHIFNLDEVLLEIKRVVKPQGKILVSIPFAWDEHEKPYDFARYTSFGIKHIIEKNGFEIIYLKKTTTYFLAVCQILIAYIYQHVFPKNNIINLILQLIIIFPLNVFSLILNLILPKNYNYYSNILILAKKK